jgi:hypothetical protein
LFPQSCPLQQTVGIFKANRRMSNKKYRISKFFVMLFFPSTFIIPCSIFDIRFLFTSTFRIPHSDFKKFPPSHLLSFSFYHPPSTLFHPASCTVHRTPLQTLPALCLRSSNISHFPIPTSDFKQFPLPHSDFRLQAISTSAFRLPNSFTIQSPASGSSSRCRFPKIPPGPRESETAFRPQWRL